MDIKAPLDWNSKYPILIAGPCSAESETQLLETAEMLKKSNIDLFRAGVWKPRTRPGNFEGVGALGLKWLQGLKHQCDLRVCTEVANARHVEQALAHDIDALWIGARTTANPFSVQEIARALAGTDIPVLVKNPISPDFKLWLGAIERLYKVGIDKLAAVHRGFSSYHHAIYRNAPMWQIPIELKRHHPTLKIICDHSHISGRRDLLWTTAQYAMDLQFDGLMTEVHLSPERAQSDAMQQIDPKTYQDILAHLRLRGHHLGKEVQPKEMSALRARIDQLDEELLALLGRRMQISEEIAEVKKQHNMSIFQPERWDTMINKAIGQGKKLKLSEQFVRQLLDAIHIESIDRQSSVMNSEKA